MISQDFTFPEGGMIALDLVDPGLTYRRLAGCRTPQPVCNDADAFLFALPLRGGQVRLEGECGAIFDGEVGPGTVRIVQPGETAALSTPGGFDEMLLSVPGPLLRDHATRHGMEVASGRCPDLRPLLAGQDAIRRLLPLLKLAHGVGPARRQALIDGLSATIMALMLDGELHAAPAGRGLDAEAFASVARFAEQRLGRGIDLDEWACFAGLTVDEFSRRFARYTGLAPYAWFMDRRIDRAKELMLGSGRTLVDIALETGFCSQSHFTEAFRRRTGVAPGRWRKAHRVIA